MSLYLSYNPKKGLIKSENGILYGNYIKEHDEKGWETPLHEQSIDIPSQNVKIVVRTNLHYGLKSYMNATITMHDKVVLNFTDTNLCHSIKFVHAEPGNWDALFDSIINLYNSIYNSGALISNYFNNIDNKLKNISSKPPFDLVIITDRLAEISDEISKSIYNDSNILNNRMKSASRLLLLNLSKGFQQKIITEGERNKIETNLQHILKHFSDRDELYEILTGYYPRK